MSSGMPDDLERALKVLAIDVERVTEWSLNAERGGYDVKFAPYANAVNMLINVVPIHDLESFRAET